jgi:signal peptidase I
MKKFLIILSITFGALMIALIVCRFTGILNYYSIATSSNEPTLRKNSIVFASNLKKPVRFDFILYKPQNPEFSSTAWIHRLCGMPGDKIQLINGVLFVNNQNTESDFSTYRNYVISNTDLGKIRKNLKIEDDQIYTLSEDSSIIPLQKRFIRDYNLAVRPFFTEDDNGEIFNIYKRKWTPDNFGPLVIPFDSYFVLGDNRGNSVDSRYIGCINKKNYIATKLGPE